MMRTASGCSVAGRGGVHAGEQPARVPLQMGTLSKAIGAYGGYLCASRPVIDLIRTRARTLIYATGLPPGTIAAAIAALDLIAAQPAYAALPVLKARLFTAAARTARGRQPDRATDPGRGAGCAGGLAPAGGGRVPGVRHPPADRARGHLAAALHLHRPALRTRRSPGWRTLVRARILGAA